MNAGRRRLEIYTEPQLAGTLHHVGNKRSRSVVDSGISCRMVKYQVFVAFAVGSHARKSEDRC